MVPTRTSNLMRTCASTPVPVVLRFRRLETMLCDAFSKQHQPYSTR